MNNQTLEQLEKRNLDSLYFCIYCITTNVYLQEKEDEVNIKTIYTFWGCNIQGKRKYISSCIANNFSTASSWYNFFQKLKNRHLENILFASIPDNKQLSDAIKLAFPDTECFLSSLVSLNKLAKYMTEKYTASFYKEIKDIYVAKNINDFNNNIAIFNDKYKDSKFILDLLENDFKLAKKCYDKPYELRSAIIAFFFSRDLRKRLAVISHTKPFFMSLNDFISAFIYIIPKCERAMYCPKNDWLNIINILYSTKYDLIKSYL